MQLSGDRMDEQGQPYSDEFGLFDLTPGASNHRNLITVHSSHRDPAPYPDRHRILEVDGRRTIRIDGRVARFYPSATGAEQSPYLARDESPGIIGWCPSEGRVVQRATASLSGRCRSMRYDMSNKPMTAILLYAATILAGRTVAAYMPPEYRRGK